MLQAFNNIRRETVLCSHLFMRACLQMDMLLVCNTIRPGSKSSLSLALIPRYFICQFQFFKQLNILDVLVKWHWILESTKPFTGDGESQANIVRQLIGVHEKPGTVWDKVAGIPHQMDMELLSPPTVAAIFGFIF
ncbi:hypothetical protein IFM89_037648 [Coptis chinensis]|uniref:Uncharacterized protein n=1 Tax=Coptis chinensis TaxID=261450 RepID=A0A835IVP3_9MAGN|nr:hypothetical protein IFM89_037648 [Coptis chinensis]